MQPQDLLTEVYAAFNRRDLDAILPHMDPHVDWPNVMDNIRLHGHDAVRAYWLRQWTVLNPHVHPVRIDVQQNQTIVDVHQVVRDLDGNILVDQIVQHVYVIQAERIQRMEICPSGENESSSATLHA